MKTIIIVLIIINSLNTNAEILQIKSVIGEIKFNSKTKNFKQKLKNLYEDNESENYFYYIDKKDLISSSSLRSIRKNDYDVKNSFDYNLETAWVEGVNGYGIGEWIEIKTDSGNVPIRKIHIYNGYVKNEKTWKENSRVKQLKLYVDGIPYAILDLKDIIECQTFNISKQFFQKNSIKLEVLDVYKGEKYKDTAISEIIFQYYSNCFPATTNITLSDGSAKTIDKIKSGDEILTCNTLSKKTEKTKVVSTTKVEHDNLVKIDFGDRVITSTDDHPYLSDKGWVSCNTIGTKQYRGYEDVKEMKIGDKIYFIDNTGKTELKEVKGIKKVDKKEMCYTITKLSNGNNFIADGAVVGVEDTAQ